MAQTCEISEQVQLKVSAEKFYEFFKNKMEFFVEMFPETCKSYEIVEGNGFSHGSIIIWKYDLGRPSEVKSRLLLDPPNKSIGLECLEGDVMTKFDVFNIKVQAIDGGANGGGGGSVKWCLEFVKANADEPPPVDYLKFGVKVCKGLDAYLSKN